MYEGVEAGEDEQRHHGTQSHHIVKLGLQHIASISAINGLVGLQIEGDVSRRVFQPTGEVLKKRMKECIFITFVILFECNSFTVTSLCHFNAQEHF